MRGYAVVVDFLPRPVDGFVGPRIEAAQRTALFDLVTLLAPDAARARHRLQSVLENATWSPFDPEDALIETLVDGIDGGLAWLERGIAGPEAIRDHLASLSTCPEGMTWDEHGDEVDFFGTEAALLSYLRSSADRCRAVGAALIRVLGGERGLVLGFVPRDALDRLGELAASARVDIVVYGADGPDDD